MMENDPSKTSIDEQLELFSTTMKKILITKLTSIERLATNNFLIKRFEIERDLIDRISNECDMRDHSKTDNSQTIYFLKEDLST